jgi:hypothetical protein
MVLTIGLKSILGWERLPLFGRYGYVEMIKCLTIKTLPSCRLLTELLVKVAISGRELDQTKLPCVQVVA